MASMNAERLGTSKSLGIGSKVSEAKPKASSPKSPAAKKTEQTPRAPTKKVQAKVSKSAAKN
ncbi:hypothetical protein MA16_Dca005205 [Dendrobium catenatum]|uniref:Uncharacterized protein n=1 Tax=Dendrobium catenatum TaxID=906689 RepID=A0A2I0VLJ7_9ASPA|nr:hypothetical protein MA16_Dca005205 [Dendrobium catenatum]